MILFLKNQNLRDHLTRDEQVEFFKEMLLDSEALKSFQTLLREIAQYAIKGKELKLESLESYRKYLIEDPQGKTFAHLENAQFLRDLKKINKKYWKFSYYQLEEYLKMLTDLSEKSKFTNEKIKAIMDCLKRELK